MSVSTIVLLFYQICIPYKVAYFKPVRPHTLTYGFLKVGVWGIGGRQSRPPIPKSLFFAAPGPVL